MPSSQGAKISIQYLELVLIVKLSDEIKREIILDPDITLGVVKKYLYDFGEGETKSKLIPIFYRLKK